MKMRIREPRPVDVETEKRAQVILRHGQTLAFSPRGTEVGVLCVAGCLLVTQTGDPRDHLLAPGEYFHSAPKGKVVIGCLRLSTVAIETHASLAPAAKESYRPQAVYAWPLSRV